MEHECTLFYFCWKAHLCMDVHGTLWTFLLKDISSLKLQVWRMRHLGAIAAWQNFEADWCDLPDDSRSRPLGTCHSSAVTSLSTATKNSKALLQHAPKLQRMLTFLSSFSKDMLLTSDSDSISPHQMAAPAGPFSHAEETRRPESAPQREELREARRSALRRERGHSRCNATLQ